MKVMKIEIKHSIKEYLNKIRPYWKDVKNDHKKSDTWKIQLTIAIIGFKSTKYSEFVFDCVHLTYYKWHKINPNRAGSYIHSPD